MQVIRWQIGLLVGLMCVMLSTISAAADEEAEITATDAAEQPKATTTDSALTVKEIEFEGIMEDSEGPNKKYHTDPCRRGDLSLPVVARY